MDKIREFLDYMPKRLKEYENLLTGQPLWQNRLQGVGYLDAAGALALGVTGPMLRSAGLAWDLRKTEPYCGYETYDFDVPTSLDGDCWARYIVRMEEMRQSLRIIEQVLDRLEPGPVMIEDKKIAWPAQLALGPDGMGNSLEHIRQIMGTSMESLIHHFKLVTEGFRVPAGQVYSPVESPRGELGYHMVSDGGTRPYRVHVRDPSFINLQSTPALTEGALIADVIAAVASHRPRDGRCRPMSFSDETRAAAAEIIARYPEGRSRSALLPMLHLVQSEEGYVTPAGIAFCAETLGLTKAEVGAVATFYTMYKRRPTGEYLVSVCTNLSCQILGGEDVFDRVADKLGVHHNETTEDGTFTLEHAECLAACDFAPVVTVNYEFFDNVTPDSAEGLLDALARGERPLPTRGATVLVQGDQPPAGRLPDPVPKRSARAPLTRPGDVAGFRARVPEAIQRRTVAGAVRSRGRSPSRSEHCPGSSPQPPSIPSVCANPRGVG